MHRLIIMYCKCCIVQLNFILIVFINVLALTNHLNSFHMQQSNLSSSIKWLHRSSVEVACYNSDLCLSLAKEEVRWLAMKSNKDCNRKTLGLGQMVKTDTELSLRRLLLMSSGKTKVNGDFFLLCHAVNTYVPSSNFQGLTRKWRQTYQKT